MAQSNTCGIFLLSDPVDALVDNSGCNNSFVQGDIVDENQLTTNSEDLRQLSKDVREFAINNPTSGIFRVRNDIKSSAVSSREGSIMYEQNEDYQRMRINYEVTKEQGELDKLLSQEDYCGWVVVLGSLMCMMVVDGICYTYGLNIQWIKSFFNLKTNVLAVLPGGLVSGIYLIVSPFDNPLADYFSYRIVAMLGCILSTTFLVVSFFTTSFVCFTVSFGIFVGIGFGLMYLPAIAIIAHWFYQMRAIAIGVALCGSGIGTCILSYLIPFLISIYSWHGVLIILAGICFQSMVGIACFCPFEVHQKLKEMKRKYQMWRLANATLIKEQKRLKKERKMSKMMRKEQKRREKLAKKKKIVIKRGSIFTRIMEEKSRQRNVSTGSLDGMMITQQNQLVNASQVDMSGLKNNNYPIFSVNATSLTSLTANHPVLSARSVEKVVEATLRVVKSGGSRRNSISNFLAQPSSFRTPSKSLSKKSSIISIEEYVGQNDAMKDEIPMELVKEYMERQRSNREDCESTAGNNSMTFKVGSFLSTNAESVNEAGTTIDVESHQPLQRLQSDISTELSEEVQDVLRSELLKAVNRPSSRKDLYYSGSMSQLVAATQIMNNSSVPVNGKMTTNRHSYPFMNSKRDLENMDEVDNLTNNSSQTQKAKSQLKWWLTELVDVSLYSTFSFQLLLFSCFTMMLGFLAPFFFLPILLNSESMTWTSLSITNLGLSNIFGRLLATLYLEKGWAYSHKKMNGINLTIIFLFVSSISLILIPFVYKIHITAVIILSFTYGFSVALVVSIRSMLVVELFGIENLTKSFTIVLIFQGLASVVGPLICGFICDYWSEGVFIFGGLTFAVSAVSLIPLSKEVCGKKFIRYISTANSFGGASNHGNTNKSLTNYPQSYKQQSASLTIIKSGDSDSECYDPQTTQTTNLMDGAMLQID